MMNKLLFSPLLLSSLVLLLGSCSSGGGTTTLGKPGVDGEIVPSGVSGKIIVERPRGMVPIPGGSFVLGMSDVDFSTLSERAPLKTVTVSPFFMDETETTNGQYRVFVNYVRDSVVRTLLAQKAEGASSGENNKGRVSGIGSYSYLVRKAGKDQTPYQKFLEDHGGKGGNDASKRLDWSVPLHYSTSDYPDEPYAEVLESMYISPSGEGGGKKRSIDVRKLRYAYRQVESQSIAVYPDTMVWGRDFKFAYNEPLFDQYFWHSAYRSYPVVGVTWDQAKAYCDFRTKLKSDYNKRLGKKDPRALAFRLPTEAEWEYAARGGLQNAPYPWGGPYLTDDRGCYMANFKPRRGSYVQDEERGFYAYTSPVKKFPKNGYGLYDMAGNVSEWTESPYNNSAYLFASTLNPSVANKDYDGDRRSVRGGSWKDVGYLLMVGYRDWEVKDSARSYIGFRTVQDIPEVAFGRFMRRGKGGAAH